MVNNPKQLNLRINLVNLVNFGEERAYFHEKLVQFFFVLIKHSLKKLSDVLLGVNTDCIHSLIMGLRMSLHAEQKTVKPVIFVQNKPVPSEA